MVSNNTKMEFELAQCVKANFKKGKKMAVGEIPLNNNQVIQDLYLAETYKCIEM